MTDHQSSHTAQLKANYTQSCHIIMATAKKLSTILGCIHRNVTEPGDRDSGIFAAKHSVLDTTIPTERHPIGGNVFQ